VSLSRLLAHRLRHALALVLSLLWPLLAGAGGGSTPLIYEVRSQSNTVYLFGTVHVGSSSLFPLSAQVEEAFARSRTLALEANPLDQQAVTAALARATYRPPDDLSKHVSPALFERISTVSPRVGLPVEFARRMKPHLLAMTLALMEIQRLGYDPSLGLDIYLAQRAVQSGRPIVELESMERQVDLFESLPDEAQEGMLKIAADAIEDGSIEKELQDLLAAWAAGDAERLQANILREMQGLPEALARELRVAVYDRRNEAMSEKIAGFLAGNEPVFVAVGAGHLTGETGIPELLKRKGFAVKRL
jgi:hypothetical protein